MRSDGKVALLDFGLVAQMDLEHQEAMASGVLNIMAQNYEALVPIFKRMGILDPNVVDLRRPGVQEPFPDALRRCMGGDAGRRQAFGQLYEELSSLVFDYRFVIPSYYILVMRAFVTLEGIALSSDDEFNMYDAAAPYARKKLLNPQTRVGRVLLRRALTTAEGRQALLIGLRWKQVGVWLMRQFIGVPRRITGCIRRRFQKMTTVTS